MSYLNLICDEVQEPMILILNWLTSPPASSSLKCLIPASVEAGSRMLVKGHHIVDYTHLNLQNLFP